MKRIYSDGTTKYSIEFRSKATNKWYPSLTYDNETAARKMLKILTNKMVEEQRIG